MFKKNLSIIFLMSILLTQSLFANNSKELLIYTTISVVKPIKEIAKAFEKKYNVTVKITQGGSRDLYDALRYSKKGDLYIPGCESYRKMNLNEGFLLESQTLAYNKAAIFVQKGNPTNVKTLDDILGHENYLIMGDSKTSSIGRMTKLTFMLYKGDSFYNEAYDKSIEIASDSRNITKAIITKKATVALNWIASSTWEDNKDHIDIIKLDDTITPKKTLLINLLSFSENKELARAFMKFSASKVGQNIMIKNGFSN